MQKRGLSLWQKIWLSIAHCTALPTLCCEILKNSDRCPTEIYTCIYSSSFLKSVQIDRVLPEIAVVHW